MYPVHRANVLAGRIYAHGLFLCADDFLASVSLSLDTQTRTNRDRTALVVKTRGVLDKLCAGLARVNAQEVVTHLLRCTQDTARTDIDSSALFPLLFTLLNRVHAGAPYCLVPARSKHDGMLAKLG